MQQITSFQNSKIKLANRLTSKRHREAEQLFLVDYARDLERALVQGYQLEYAFYSPQLASSADNALLVQLDETLVYEVSPDLMDKASYRQNPSGLVAIMQQKAPLRLDDVDEDGHILALVNLSKPGNIGALLRTADAAGIQAIFLIDVVLDIYNPNIIRASTGTVFLDNIYQVKRDDALGFFARHDIKIIATHLDGKKNLYEFDFAAGRTAVVLGAEDTGLNDDWIVHCDDLVKIPMMGDVSDSLNVSVSGAIIMYEVLRQQSTTR